MGIHRTLTVLVAVSSTLLLWGGCNDFSVAENDNDQDGWTQEEGDCDDQDPERHPDATEVCDGVDNDCDDEVDEDQDLDLDGYTACGPDGEEGTEDDDCDDTDPNVNPGATETPCDGVDNDCDLDTEDDPDADGDGATACEDCDDEDAALNLTDADGDGHSSCDGDCDDANSAVFPGQDEAVCDDVDNDCDPVTEDTPDTDGDAYTVCEDCDDDDHSLNLDDLDSDMYSTCSGDCDDENAAVNPAAAEVCSGLDDDCDGDMLLSEVDADGDGYLECEECDDTDPLLNLADLDGDGYTTCDDDCDDGHAGLHPGDDDGDGWSTCDGDCNDADTGLNLDDTDGDGASTCGGDCDDFDASLNLTDLDGDGVTTCDGDCDDGNAATHPSATEICDGQDNNCNGSIPPDETDDDGDGTAECNGDCDDAAATVHEGAADVCDVHLDNDCDGVTDPQEADDDGDGASECDGDCDDVNGELNLLDDDGDGWTTCDGDCDDAASDANPGESEVCEDGIDNDCDGIDDLCGPAGIIDLAHADARLIGEDAGDWAGNSVALLEDANGDGYADLLIGARKQSDHGAEAGAAYLVSGPVYATVDLSAAQAEILGEDAYDKAGVAVSSAGDVNGDGFTDLLVGAHGTDDNGSNSGTAYILHGPVSGSIDIENADARIHGDNLCNAGFRLSAVGDMNGDGYDDVLAGGEWSDSGAWDGGTSYIYYGPLSGDYFPGDADAERYGEEAEDHSGYGLAGGGDVNGDGLADALIGARYHDEAGSNAGAAYLFLGPVSGEAELSTANAKITGEAVGDVAGENVAFPGDLDGDGFGDVLVGAPFHDAGGAQAGAAYLLLGPLTGQISLSSADAKFVGTAENDYAGRVAAVGDVNGDGDVDLLIGANGNDTNGTDAGAVYLFYGMRSGTVDLDSADAIFLGEAAGDGIGEQGMLHPADVDGDGFDDILIGGHLHDSGGSDAGAAYLVYGGR